LVTSPISMMRPINDMMFRVSPVKKSTPMTPTSDSGREIMMASGAMKLSNCAARMR